MVEENKGGWFGRLKAGLQRSSEKISTGITELFTKRKLDAEALQDLKYILIQGDLGVSTATRLTSLLAKTRFDQEISSEEIKIALAEEVATILAPVAQPLVIDGTHKPHIILVCGTNGSGKTTFIRLLTGLYYADKGGIYVDGKKIFTDKKTTNFIAFSE